MLNNPGNNLVLSEEFLPMVKRLDECIGYLGEHVSQRTLSRIGLTPVARFQRC